MGTHGTSSMPIFFYKAIADEISPIADTDVLLQQFCNAGTFITYVRDSFREHFTQAKISTGDVLSYLMDRVNGVSLRDALLGTSTWRPWTLMHQEILVWPSHWSC
jgi:hypothetical protein